MSTNNTALEPIQPAPIAPAEPAPILRGAELMEKVFVDRASTIPHETSELAPVAPVSPVEPEPAPADIAPPAPVYYDYQPQTESDFVALDLITANRRIALDLGASFMNLLPDLIEHNRNFLLGVLGLPGASTGEAVRELRKMQADEYVSARAMVAATYTVFDEYVAKGKALGLNDLEAAGLAALTYAEAEAGYWQEGSAWRPLFHNWRARLKSGNQVQVADARKAFVRAFDAVYRKLASKYAPGIRKPTNVANLRGEDLMGAIIQANQGD